MKQTLELIDIGKIISLGLNVDVSIELYGDNIISSLNEISEEYKKDNYKKLFELIEKDLNKSIEEIDLKINQFYNIYSKYELLPENEIIDLKNSTKRDANNLIQIEFDKIYSCYTLNDKIIDYVKEQKLIDECIEKLKRINNNDDENKDLPLEISNFPKLLNNEDEENININNYLEIYKYFENEKRKEYIKYQIKNDDSVVKKVFDYVLSNALKKGLNENEYFYLNDIKFYENCEKYKWIKTNNLFNNLIKETIDESYFDNNINEFLFNFELIEEPNQKLKYLEDVYNIIKIIYELSINCSFNNFRIYILIWEYYIIHFCPKKFYSSILKIHLFIRKDLLTKTQSIILFQIKEVINNILNESINIISNEYNNDDNY